MGLHLVTRQKSLRTMDGIYVLKKKAIHLANTCTKLEHCEFLPVRAAEIELQLQREFIRTAYIDFFSFCIGKVTKSFLLWCIDTVHKEQITMPRNKDAPLVTFRTCKSP